MKELKMLKEGRLITVSHMSLRKTPYAPDSTFIISSFVSFGLAGVLLIAGFVIGPPKEGVTTETQVDSAVE